VELLEEMERGACAQINLSGREKLVAEELNVLGCLMLAATEVEIEFANAVSM